MVYGVWAVWYREQNKAEKKVEEAVPWVSLGLRVDRLENCKLKIQIRIL